MLSCLPSRKRQVFFCFCGHILIILLLFFAWFPEHSECWKECVQRKEEEEEEEEEEQEEEEEEEKEEEEELAFFFL